MYVGNAGHVYDASGTLTLIHNVLMPMSRVEEQVYGLTERVAGL